MERREAREKQFRALILSFIFKECITSSQRLYSEIIQFLLKQEANVQTDYVK